MNKKRNEEKWLFILILLTLPYTLNAQLNASMGTEGTDFYLSFGNNYLEPASSSLLKMQIKIVSQHATTVRLSFGDNTSLDTQRTLSANSITLIDLNARQIAAVYASTSTTGKSKKSLRIQSNQPIAVYALNLRQYVSDATNILPVHRLGTNYYHISYTPADSYSHDGYTVVATDNNTIIYENGVSKTTLQQGEVYSVYSGVDMTGMHVTSSKPVAYFATSDGVLVPKGHNSVDILYQQFPSLETWGRQFVVPVTTQGVERIRIMATKDGTRLTVNGGQLISGSTLLNAGKYTEYELTSADKSMYISSDKPVGVCSYLTGMDYPSRKTKGDPTIFWIAPIEQGLSRVTVAPFTSTSTATGYAFSDHYAMIITSTATKSQTEVSVNRGIPGGLSGGVWSDNIDSKYSSYIMPLTDTPSNYYTFSNAAGLSVQIYGVGNSISYAYLGGSGLYNLNMSFYVNNIHYEDIDGQTHCEGPFNFNAKLEYLDNTSPGYLKWYVDGVEEVTERDKINWNKNLNEGTHTIRMDIKDAAGIIRNISTSFIVIKCASRRILLPVNPGAFFQ